MNKNQKRLERLSKALKKNLRRRKEKINGNNA